MRIQASAGPDRRKDLKDYCYSLKLTAQTDEEARWLSVLLGFVEMKTDGMPCFPGTHQFETRRAGGAPDAVESYEMVRYCKACGWEDDSD